MMLNNTTSTCSSVWYWLTIDWRIHQAMAAAITSTGNHLRRAPTCGAAIGVEVSVEAITDIPSALILCNTSAV